jgi:hypothetical protein
MVPLTPVQKKIYLSVLRKELQTLLSFTGGSSRHQSLQNIVMVFFFCLEASLIYVQCHNTKLCRFSIIFMLGTGDLFNQISLFDFSWLSSRVHSFCLMVGFVNSLFINYSSACGKKKYFIKPVIPNEIASQ